MRTVIPHPTGLRLSWTHGRGMGAIEERDGMHVASKRATLGLVALIVVCGPTARGRAAVDDARPEDARPERGPALPASDERRNTVYLPASMARRLGVRTEPARVATHSGALFLRGVLAIDPAHHVRVRPRFGGEVVEVGTTRGAEGEERELGPGDRVAKGQRLAI